MQTKIILIVIMVIMGIPIGVLIDHIADKCGLSMQDGLNPVPWAILGLIWPISLFPFFIYCLWHKDENKKK